ncbi:MAG: FHA domain-containing protein [Myxococcales bacterium]|nr:FHA domain-containing protein [Myxococcales bacterium]
MRTALFGILLIVTAAVVGQPATVRAVPDSPSTSKVAAPPKEIQPVTPTKAWGRLVTVDGKQRWELTKPVLIVGSDANADVVISDKTVTAQHAKFSHADGVISIEDLGSKSGTLAAGTALKRGKPFRVLQPVDVALGAVLLRFEFGERPALIPPTQAPPKGKKPQSKPAKGAK